MRRGTKPTPLRERFDAKWTPEPNTGCWLWMAALSKYGYGKIGNEGERRTIPAHRASYLLHVGPIPAGLFVCHACDVRHCVNPDHLWLGDAGDNARDAASKGRTYFQTHPDMWPAALAKARIAQKAKAENRTIPPCANCGRVIRITRRGLCGACGEYRRRNGRPRPPGGASRALTPEQREQMVEIFLSRRRELGVRGRIAAQFGVSGSAVTMALYAALGREAAWR